LYLPRYFGGLYLSRGYLEAAKLIAYAVNVND